MKLWLAQGFGLGRIPFAPGTFGSVLGLAWFGLLLCGRSEMFFVLGGAAGIAASVWLCGEGERILKQHDPGSVVLDETAAMPLCFVTWLAAARREQGFWPAPAYFFCAAHWLQTLAVFALFRVFDVLKPWPVRQSQSLRGGWGITVDDVLAAGYVNLVVLAFI